MIFKKINDTTLLTAWLETIITEQLELNKQVLLLLSGGSAIKLSYELFKNLSEHDLRKLHVTLMDERYGPVGHADSNWYQLQAEGTNFGNAQVYPVLAGKEITLTTEQFGATLEQVFALADHTIGLFGMGADGHTAGLLPHSDAIDQPTWAASFTDPDYERITMTPWSLTQLDEAVLYAIGDQKLAALNNLKNKEIDLHTQPVQLLKSIPTVTVYNDQIGDTI